MFTVSIYYYVKPLSMHIRYIYLFWNKSEQETGNGHCPYLLFCGATLYAYYIHMYFFETSMNRKLAMVTVPIYYYVNPLFMEIRYIYIFWNNSEQEIGNGHCPYPLSCVAILYTY